MDPFDEEDPDQLSVEEDPNNNNGDEVQALMRAELEKSPFIIPTPPMLQNQFVTGPPGGPTLPQSSKDGPTLVLSPKKRKAEEGMLTEGKVPDMPSATQSNGENPQEKGEGMAAIGEPSGKKIKLDLNQANTSNSSEKLCAAPIIPQDGRNLFNQAGSVPVCAPDDMHEQTKNLPAGLSRPIADKAEPIITVLSKPAPSTAMTLEKMQAMRKQDILAIVTGTRSPISKQADNSRQDAALPQPDVPVVSSSPNGVPAKAAANAPLDLSALKPSSQDGRHIRRDRKRAPKPIRRILNARKETEQAAGFVEDTTDLLDYLTEADCKFLAASVWIFTKKQLLSVLDPSSFDRDTVMNLDEKSQWKVQAETCRLKLRDKLAEKYYFERRPEEKKMYEEHRKAVVRALVEECKTGKDVPLPSLQDSTQCGEVFPQADHSQLEAADDIPGEAVLSLSNHVSSKGTDDRPLVDEHGAGMDHDVNRDEKQETTSSNPFNMPKPGANDLTDSKTVISAPVLHPILASYMRREREIISGVEDILAKRQNLQVTPKEEEDVIRAEAKMGEWLNCLKRSPSRSTRAEDQFPLGGPISVLIPAPTRSFFATAKLVSLFDFLRTRRTETGALCEMMRIFRHQCQLPYLNHLALARHLLGLSTRLETAIGSRLPLDDKTRRWMGGSLIVCTGASQEYIVGRLGMSASWQFLDSKTKALSIDLASWREEKGLNTLKGSGKVAMISAWKAMLREEDDAVKGTGKILTDVDLEKEASQETPVIHDETEQPEVAVKKPVTNFFATSTVSIDYASHSPLFVEHCLGKNVADFLIQFRVATASQLEAAKLETNPLVAKKMQECGMADSVEACHLVIQKWLNVLRDKARTVVSTKTPVRPTKAKESAPKETKPVIKKVPLSNLSDPFSVLSAITQKFLRSIGITTGEQFLSRRTTEIAEQFVEFRIQNGMPELKGLGAIASVSGWKAQCRKAATDMGLKELAATEPDSMIRATCARRKQNHSKEGSNDTKGDIAAHGPPQKLIIQPLPPLEDIADEEILSGRSKVDISVVRGQGSMRFDFEISVRKKAKGLEPCYYVTYKGTANHPFKTMHPIQTVELLRPELPSLALPVLPMASLIQPIDFGTHDSRQPFSTVALGCGLIDLSCCGVRIPQIQDVAPLKVLIEEYLLGQQSSTSFPEVAPADDTNVLIARRESGTQLFLFVKNPMEKGQTIPLRFPSLATLLSREKHATDNLQSVIGNLIRVLSERDLCEILNWTHDKYLNEWNGRAESTSNGDAIRQRLHWLSRRIVKCKKDLSGEVKEIVDTLFYWPTIPSGPSSHGAEPYKRATSAVSGDIMSFAEDHPLCRSHVRENWFELARGRFPFFVENLVTSLFAAPDLTAAERLERTKSAIKAFTLVEKPSMDCLQLHDVHGRADVLNKKVPVVACSDPHSNPARVIFKPVAEVKNDEEVALSWYRGILSVIAKGLLKIILVLFDGGEKSDTKVIDTVKALLENSSLEENISLVVPERFLGVACTIPLSPSDLKIDGSSSDAVPASYQFFLGIVWPALREQRWRLEAGESADDITFFPPKIGKLKRSNPTKNEGNRKRLRLVREVEKLGWGAVGKLTQRVVLEATKNGKAENGHFVTVEAAAGQVYQWIQKELDPEDKHSREKAKSIMNATLDCYNIFAPLMAEGLGWKAVDASAEKSSLKYGSETLLQMLLVLPSILQQSSLPLQQISDSFQVIREFVDVFTANATKMLPTPMQPEPEYYADDLSPAVSALGGRLKLLHSDSGTAVDAGNENAHELTEIIIESDKVTADGRPLLTDFVVLVMEQVIPVRATDEDTEKKNRRIHVGYPGMACRHCIGKSGEGRYFFSSLESMSTASTVLEKHMLRCPMVSNEIKASITEAKMRHTVQRKDVPVGEQQAFFNRLWNRLRSSIIGLGAANILSSSRKEEELPTEDDTDSVALEFRDHLELLDFVRNTSPWKNIKSVQTALNTYYSCLDYGGRIYQTPSMPPHFSSEWLLAKVVPKRYEYVKAKYLPVD